MSVIPQEPGEIARKVVFVLCHGRCVKAKEKAVAASPAIAPHRKAKKVAKKPVPPGQSQPWPVELKPP